MGEGQRAGVDRQHAGRLRGRQRGVRVDALGPQRGHHRAGLAAPPPRRRAAAPAAPPPVSCGSDRRTRRPRSARRPAAPPAAAAEPRRCSAVSRRTASSRASGLPPVAATSGSTRVAATCPRSSSAASAAGSPASRCRGSPASSRAGPVPPGQQHRDPVGAEPAGGEAERDQRLPVHPLHVVHDQQDRLPLGRGGQQRQRRRGDQVAVTGGRRPGPAERGAQRVPLRPGHGVEVLAQRHAARRAAPRARARGPRPPRWSGGSGSPVAARSAASSRVVLPMPGSPSRHSTALRPARAASRTAPMAARSGPRPTITTAHATTRGGRVLGDFPDATAGGPAGPCWS